MVTNEIKESISRSVLCWLATCNASGVPNVSPKEIFTSYKETHIAIANIASPESVRNIRENGNVSVSFIDIFVQKGFQLKGRASIIEEGDLTFDEIARPLISMAGDRFPFKSLIFIEVLKVKRISAPSYILYPETTEAEQVESAIKTYKLKL